LEPSREALLEACAGGDTTALHRLYSIVSPQLFGLALGIVRRREQAEEILQDSFLLVWRHARSFDRQRGSAMAWLARIVRNQCFDHLRRSGRETPLDPEAMERWEDPAPGPEAAAAESESARQLLGCLDQLEANPRQCILLAYYQGMTFEEVAARLKAPLGTVKSWIRRSLVRLRTCLER
jgi:RNA polymerase sigma-70 factor (ECF subfamily)